MDELRITTLPELERPMLIGAFAGWNDAASAASWALKFLVHQWDASQFGEIDPDAFYDFTESRPKVRIERGSPGQFTWPTTRFYYYRAPREGDVPRGRDVVLVLGEEPQLRWRSFARLVMEVCQQCHVEHVVLLGALVAEVPHTTPVQVSGVSNQAAVLRHMSRSGIDLATYEGPTGILSVLQDASRKAVLSTSSLWGVAPYYVSATPNLPVSEPRLKQLDTVFGLGLRLNELTRAARRFNQRVSSLVAEDSDVSAYVRELERRLEHPSADAGTMPRPPLPSNGFAVGAGSDDLPSPEEAIHDVEAWLRRFREQSESE